jgi:hypothetical protein
MIYGKWQSTYVVAQAKPVSALITGTSTHGHLKS